MKPIELPEVLDYFQLIEGSDDCEALVKAEKEALEGVNSSVQEIDWADAAGTDELHDYWLAAESAERQAQLGKICHARAHAWHAIWQNFLS
ncbi:MAG: hypothetical protein AAFR10_12515 [Pseudomonadota bacterium]